MLYLYQNMSAYTNLYIIFRKNMMIGKIYPPPPGFTVAMTTALKVRFYCNFKSLRLFN